MTAAPQVPGLVALADRIELWPIDRLRPYERNPRTHSETQVDQIAASMVEFGWTNPVLVDEQGGILAGWAGILQADAYGRFDESKTAGSAPATTAPIGRCAELRSAPGRGSSPAPTATATVPPRCLP